LTKNIVKALMVAMPEVEVIDDPAAAAVAIEPARARLLAQLARPASAAELAQRLGLPRQKVNYHLRTLEKHGLVRESAALGPAAAEPGRTVDRLSASYLLALAARAVREVGALVRRAAASNQRLATLSIDADIRFRDAEQRAAFSQELAAAVASLASRYHDPSAPGGRWHRLVVVAHPTAGAPEPESEPTPTAKP
jgi:DNA-binding transcriptional ArsR family regulator